MTRNRAAEGRLIKKAVLAAIPDSKVRVSAGRGTAYGWWSIYLTAGTIQPCSCTFETWGPRKTCRNCSDRYRELMRLAEDAAVKSGATTYSYTDDMNYSHREINVHVTLEGQNQPEPEPK